MTLPKNVLTHTPESCKCLQISRKLWQTLETPNFPIILQAYNAHIKKSITVSLPEEWPIQSQCGYWSQKYDSLFTKRLPPHVSPNSPERNTFQDFAPKKNMKILGYNIFVPKYLVWYLNSTFWDIFELPHTFFLTHTIYFKGRIAYL